MILEPIDARDFARGRRPFRKSPAACQGPQLLRLAILVALALVLVSLTLNPGRMMTAGAEVAQGFDRV
ncbi:MAG TPA: hypothetical protein VMU18_11540 [Rhodoblastus sp.]|nr:hypothetical protein [Rhodoblastus sp.]